MSKSVRNLLTAIVPIALLALGAEARAQATDVDCNGCVDSGDIAAGAVTRGKLAIDSVNGSKIKDGSIGTEDLGKKVVTSDKIKNGAVTLNKVVPKLKNDIGTYCEPGMVVVGKDTDGNFVCESRLYYPSGPQVNVPESQLSGWTQCHQSAFNTGGHNVASILAACGGEKLLMACRLIGESNFKLLAAARRADVTFDTGDNLDQSHSANGSEWYFYDGKSWGFARGGDSVYKNSCDYQNAGNGTNDERMCVHYGGGNMDTGYRCGDSFSSIERIFFTAD